MPRVCLYDPRLVECVKVGLGTAFCPVLHMRRERKRDVQKSHMQVLWIVWKLDQAEYGPVSNQASNHDCMVIINPKIVSISNEYDACHVASAQWIVILPRENQSACGHYGNRR